MCIAQKRERGSALLIVFLFAAVLAISLYMEMPTVAFEAKRMKEQLLIDRGTEYAHAVKLYYRKFRSYPGSIDALENTNRMRFLRHRFKDPMTGDDKWRLLHAGPGGQLLDSKVNPIGLSANAQTNGTSTNAFGSSGGASNGGGNAPPGIISNGAWTPATAENGAPAGLAGIRQRPPEMPINGGAATNAANNADPTQSLLPPTSTSGDAQQLQLGGVPLAPGVPANLNGVQQSVQQLAPGSQVTNAAANPMQAMQPMIPNANPPGSPGNPATSAAPNGTAGAAGSSPSSGSAPLNTATTQSTMGVLQSGGIAGVASLAKGSAIKTVNDQSDYSLWEFYYDPTKDTSTVGQSGINPLNGAGQPSDIGSPASATPTSTSSTPQPSSAPAANPGQNPPQ